MQPEVVEPTENYQHTPQVPSALHYVLVSFSSFFLFWVAQPINYLLPHLFHQPRLQHQQAAVSRKTKTKLVYKLQTADRHGW